MSRERGAGHLLSKKRGGGTEVSAFGGSLTLTDAAIKNKNLNKHLSNKKTVAESEIERVTKHTYRRKLSLRQEVFRIEQGKRKVRYLDGDMRHKAPAQCDSNIAMKECVPPKGNKTIASYLPFLVEKDWAACHNPGSLPDLVSSDVSEVNNSTLNSQNNNTCMKESGMMRTSSLCDLDHLGFSQDKISLPVPEDRIKATCTPNGRLPAIDKKHCGLTRPQSSVMVDNNVSSTSRDHGKRQRKQPIQTANGPPQMYSRRKSRSMSDLRELLPRINSAQNEGAHDKERKLKNNQSFEDLIAAIQQRKEMYKVITEDDQLSE